LSHGALCAFGIAGHHLPYHPDRLKSGPVAEATTAVRSALGQLRDTQRCAVLDLRPGRTASWTYRRAMAAIRNGVYLAPPAPLPVNFAAAKTVLSLGAPLFDNWGTPGNVIAARDHFRLIQAEAVESRTAVMADLWLPISPGGEEALALGIANLLLPEKHAEKPIDGLPAGFTDRVREFPPTVAAQHSGLSEQQIGALARELQSNGPVLVLGANGSPYAAALNLILGAAGRTLVSRREAPVPDEWKKAAPVADLASVPDGSLDVLLIDESVAGEAPAWSAIQPKLANKAVVVTFAWSKDGYGRQSTFTLPTAVYPETVDDIPPAVDSPAAAFRLSPAWIAPPNGVVNPADFVADLAGIAAKDALQERAAAIRKSDRGSLFVPATATSTPARDVKPDEFWKLLQAGATWIDDLDANAAAPKLTVPALPAEAFNPAFPLVVAVTEPDAAALVSPLLTKIYQESNLRLAPEAVALHPSDARTAGLEAGSRARLETGRGSIAVDVTLDPDVPPGVMQVAGGPGIRKICGAASRARVVRS
jgi:hypothetical protein